MKNIGIRVPTLIVDPERAKRNISRIKKKCSDSGVRFRPHFKTHQSAEVGNWYRSLGVEAITVSSVKMASYFASHGWGDITVAFLVNPLEIDEINRLSKTIRLGLTVDSPGTVSFLKTHLKGSAGIWIKLDTGYGRSGIRVSESDKVLRLAKEVIDSEPLILKGFLAHAGHSYDASSPEEIDLIYRDTAEQMSKIRNQCRQEGMENLEISVGDTPTCSIVPELTGVDEVRCGNIVFFDVTQYRLGSCSISDIAVALACPVVGVYPERNRVVIHGGAVHLSKDVVVDPDGRKNFGLVGLLNANGFGKPYGNTVVRSLSQEHGIIHTSEPELLDKKAGDILLVYPVHACLTVNLMREMLTVDGQIVSTMGSAKGIG